LFSKADRILRDIEKMTEKSFLPIVGPRKGKVLAEIIRRIKPKRILEIGTLIGYSTILMGKELGSDAHIITVEIHSNEAAMAKENIRKAQIKPKMDVLVGDAIEILPRLEGEFDMVFIDADKREYIDYLKLVGDKLHKGSVLVADNAGIFADEMRDYLDHVRHSEKYASRYVPVGKDGLEVSVRK
jgi:predicted O-methyltransferase YrrM